MALAGRSVSGTYTNIAGPFTSGTVIRSADMNNQFSDYANALTGSLSRDGFGGMRAPLALTDGSAAAPSLTFNSDPTSGWFRPGANRAALSLGGVQRLEQNASGLIETGWAQFAGTTTFTGAATFSGAATVGGALTASSTSHFVGAATFDATINGTLVGSLDPSVTVSTANLGAGAVTNAKQSFGTPSAASDVAIKSYVDTATSGQMKVIRKDTYTFSDTNSTITQGGISEPDTNYRIILTPVATSGAAAVNSLIVKTVVKNTTSYQILLVSAPGAGTSVTYDCLMVR